MADLKIRLGPCDERRGPTEARGNWSESWIDDRIARRLWKFISGQKRYTNIARIVAEALERYVMDEEIRIVEGEGAITVVLELDHGQVLAFPLKLKDERGIGAYCLRRAKVGGATVVVRTDRAVSGRCKSLGHDLPNMTALDESGVWVGPQMSGHCARCGDRVLIQQDGRQDIDAIYAQDVAALSLRSFQERTTADLLKLVDRARRTITERQAELAGAQDALRVAQEVLGTRIVRELGVVDPPHGATEVRS